MKKLLLVLLFIPLVSFGQELFKAVLAQKAKDYMLMGSERMEVEDYEGAIADYTKAIELVPDYADAYYNRGIEKYNLDDINGACSDVRKSVNLGYTDSQDFIGQICD